MSEISQTSVNPFLQELQLVAEKKETELDKNAFLKLMVTQLNNQDPLNPQENGDFIAQLAQFSSVEGIENLNRSVGVMAGSLQSSQALQASALVGRKVHVQSDTSFLTATDDISGTIKLESSTNNLVLSIKNRAGELIEQLPLGDHQRGDVKFTWDGLREDGTRFEAGEYAFEAEASVGGVAQQMDIALSAHVDSVTINPDRSVVLNLAGLGAVPLLNVEEIL